MATLLSRPIVRLSDVVNRLAAQDYAVDFPDFREIDEIRDVGLAIQASRENGPDRQRLNFIAQWAERLTWPTIIPIPTNRSSTRYACH